MTCSGPFCVTQILFEEGLCGSFCLEPFWWLGAATEVFLKSQPYLHSQMWPSLVAILLHSMEYNWNDVFIAIPHDTNSHW